MQHQPNGSTGSVPTGFTGNETIPVEVSEVECALPFPLDETLTLLTEKQVLSILQISKSFFYRNVRIPRFVDRGVVRYRLSDVRRYIQQHMRNVDGMPIAKKRCMRTKASTPRDSLTVHHPTHLVGP